ncbi:unnamed protein product [Mytilus coruscus]|uniref:Ig-like domain-containing protein n=1 Tax=Mytilus coruscus TaxID=42192 RepID=A0A6J8EME1_MYTCO|nr:unnamed protein product [Mytilus coruscus]
MNGSFFLPVVSPFLNFQPKEKLSSPKLDADDIITRKENESISIACTSESIPKANITWYIGETLLQGFVQTVNPSENIVISNITFTAKRNYDKLQLYCSGNDTFSSMNSSRTTLNIQYSSTNSIVSELITKLKARNKSIRIADTSAGGWTTVREYEANTIADNSDDEKKIRQAESRAVRSIKERTKLRLSPYNNNRATQNARPAVTVPNPAYSQPYSRYSQPPQPFRAGHWRRKPAQYDMCHQCKQFGHKRKNCPLNRIQTFQHNTQGQGAQRS